MPSKESSTKRANARKYQSHNGRCERRARVVWMEHYGPIPYGCVVHHINEDPSDDRIENLALLTRAEHNTEHHRKYPEDCTVEGCTRPTKGSAYGYCRMHLQHMKRHGRILSLFPMKPGKKRNTDPCKVEGCERRTTSKGYCKMHYQQIFRHGRITSVLPMKTGRPKILS